MTFSELTEAARTRKLFVNSQTSELPFAVTLEAFRDLLVVARFFSKPIKATIERDNIWLDTPEGTEVVL